MSIIYNPDPAAFVGTPANVSLLSTRDVALNVPINFVKGPGVSVTAACFSHNIFDAVAAAKCISNLLAVGFKRFYVDIYWDPLHLYWSLCPAQLPLPSATAQPTILSTSSQESSQTAANPIFSQGDSGTSATHEARSDNPRVRYDGSEQTQKLHPQQDGEVTTSVVVSSTATTSAEMQSAINPVGPPAKANSGLQIYNVGPYSCNSFANVSTFLSVLEDYVFATDNTLQARFKQILFNVHVASPAQHPSAPAGRLLADQLPNGNNLIGSIANANFSSFIYTPQTLFQQRENLNTSWSAAPAQSQPDSAYFTNITNAEHVSVSPDGWPSEGYLEFYKHYRLIFAYGSVDPQLSGYDIQRDEQYVFAPSFISNELSPTVSADGSMSSGCIYSPSTSSLSTANSSWTEASLRSGDLAISALSNGSVARNETYNSAHSLTQCGILPVLNSTLSNVTADQDPTPYLTYSLSALWSWAPDQPLNDTAASSHQFPGMADSTYSDSDYRCAYFNASANAPSYEGRWFVTFCQNSLRAACRADADPYAWTLSDTRGRYSDVNDNCPSNSTFAVPRTGLENHYLLAATQAFFSDPSHSDDNDGGRTRDIVWINFNSIDVETCWVTGAETNCPYVATAGQNEGQVVVPIVAAFAIILLALLTILAKCGANRRKSRKRRRVKEGWEYEGVPS